MRRREKKTPQGQAEKTSDPGRVTEERREAALEELSFVLFQLRLAHRRCEDIMHSGDLSTVVWWRELDFIHTVLSDTDSLLRRVYNGAHDKV